MSMQDHTTRLSDDEFAALFPVATDTQLMALTGLSKSGVRHWANRLGLRKSPGHVARAHKAAGAAQRGENSPHWKGGISARLRQADPDYRLWRDAVLKRDNYTCTECGDRRRRREMHAHHILPYGQYVDRRHDVSNGITLCVICHNRLHGREIRPRIQIPCKCGCGELLDAVDKWGLSREWVRGHQGRGKTITPEQRAAIAKGGEKRRGVKRSPEFCAHLSAVKTGHTLTDAERAGYERRKARWSNKYDCCTSCGQSDSQHYGHGLCLRCYCRQRTLRRNPDAPVRPPRHREALIVGIEPNTSMLPNI